MTDDAPNPWPGENPRSNGSRVLLASLAAIAAGYADPEEVVASLRGAGVDALGVLVALFADRNQPSRRRGERIDVQSFTNRPASQPPRKPLKASTRPILLR